MHFTSQTHENNNCIRVATGEFAAIDTKFDIQHKIRQAQVMDFYKASSEVYSIILLGAIYYSQFPSEQTHDPFTSTRKFTILDAIVKPSKFQQAIRRCTSLTYEMPPSTTKPVRL